MLYMIYFSFPRASWKWKSCIAQGQTFSETAMVIKDLHGNSKSLQIVSDLWGLLGETELGRMGLGGCHDGLRASGIGCASMDNCRPWMTMISTAECKKWLSLCVEIWEEDEEIKNIYRQGFSFKTEFKLGLLYLSHYQPPLASHFLSWRWA